MSLMEKNGAGSREAERAVGERSEAAAGAPRRLGPPTPSWQSGTRAGRAVVFVAL